MDYAYSIKEIPRPVRRRLKKVMQNSPDNQYARRAHAVLLLHQGIGVSEIARQLCAARSAIGGWRERYEQLGEAGLVPETPGRKTWTVNEEVDIDFNPKLGSCWMKQGQQTTIATPGKNQKRYLVGAINADTGKVLWVEWKKKNSEIFILLLAKLRKCYRKAKTITVIAGNYSIHKSAMTQCFLRHNRKFTLLFQPAYHPWINRIEFVWKLLHDKITRNHKYSTMNELMWAVEKFMTLVSPFPGSNVQRASL